MRGAAERRTSTVHWSRQSVRRSNETLLAKWSDGWGERSGGGAGRVDDLEQASLLACGSFPLAESLAGGRVDFTRRAST